MGIKDTLLIWAWDGMGSPWATPSGNPLENQGHPLLRWESITPVLHHSFWFVKDFLAFCLSFFFSSFPLKLKTMLDKQKNWCMRGWTNIFSYRGGGPPKNDWADDFLFNVSWMHLGICFKFWLKWDILLLSLQMQIHMIFTINVFFLSKNIQDVYRSYGNLHFYWKWYFLGSLNLWERETFLMW